MGDVIEFPKTENENVTYQIGDNDELAAVADRDMGLIAGFHSGNDKDSVFIAVDGVGVDMDRKRLSEFLWFAVRFLDSHGKWQEDSYIGTDYE